MASTIEIQEVLEAIVAGIPEMASFIAAVPEGKRTIALEAAERHYLLTARDLGCSDKPARLWVSAVMVQMRDQIDQIKEQARTGFVGQRRMEGFSLVEKILTRATGALALLVAFPFIAIIWVGLRLERPGPAIALRRTKKGDTKAYRFVLGSGWISWFVRRADLATIPMLWHLLNGDNVLRLKDFSVVFRFWNPTRSYRRT